MAYDFHELNTQMERLPPPERWLMQAFVDALRAHSCFRDHYCSLQALASATDDALLRTKSQWLANVARRITISIENAFAAQSDETDGDAIVEGEYTEVDPEPLARLSPESSNEGLT